MTTRTPYPSYKPSGIDWLGDIPSHWNVRRVQHLAHLNMASLPENTESSYQFEYVDIGAVGTGVLVEEPEQVQFGDSPSRARRIVKSGDTILSTVRTYLKAVYHFDNVSSPVIVSTGFTTLTPKQAANSRFMKWAVVSDGFVSEVESQSTGVSYPAINETKVAKLPLPLPPLEEQRAIADYLDRKDAQITRFIESRRRMIALLEEKKQAIINQAVTKGLDPSVPMKESGVEWLGEIPAHWEVRKLGHAFGRIGSGTTPSSGDKRYYEGGTIPWVITGDLRDRPINPNRSVTEIAVQEYSALRLHPSGSLIVAMYGATIGKTGILKFDATVNQACLVLSEPRLVSAALAQAMLIAFRSSLIDLAVGGGQPNINSEIVRQFRISVPPAPEQKQILRHITRVEDVTSMSTARFEREIELMKEYRTRLISDVVTGKVRVR